MASHAREGSPVPAPREESVPLVEAAEPKAAPPRGEAADASAVLPAPVTAAAPTPTPLERALNVLPAVLSRASLAFAALLAVLRLFPLAPGPLSSLRSCPDLVDGGGAWEISPSQGPPAGTFYVPQNSGVLHAYTGKDIAACVENTEWHFVGDSRARELMLDVASRTLQKGEEKITYGKHQDFYRDVGTGRIKFDWDPFGNITLPKVLARAAQTDRRTVVIASHGLWFLRYEPDAAMPLYLALLKATRDALAQSPVAAESALYFWPPGHVQPFKLNEERRRTMTNAKIDELAAALRADQLPVQPSVHLPWTWKDLLDRGIALEASGRLEATTDGLHYSPVLVRGTADYFLNHLCNRRVLAGVNGKSSVCGAGGGWKGGQILSILVLLALGAAGFLVSRANHPPPSSLSWLPPKLGHGLFDFLVPVMGSLLADRTPWLAAAPKLVSVPRLAIILALSGIPAALTWKSAPEAKQRDAGFLNRDQTEEWRGWMQVAILVYHYTGTSKVGWVYAVVRVLVGAYLFMTGYGHASYFLTKKQFPLSRLVNLLLRLNLLPILLAYVLDAPFLGYYFSPLVSLYFVAIWLAFWPASKYNDRLPVLLAKCAVVWGVTWYLHAADTRLVVAAFAALRSLGIDWDAREWCFRVALDCWAPLLGVAVAWATINWERMCALISLTPLSNGLDNGLVTVRAALVGGALCMLAWLGVWYASKDKFDYNTRHPWASLLPILGYCALRNATAALRRSHSVFAAWVGKISLETFILQFHVWLAMDTRAILAFWPGPGAFWGNLAAATGFFLWTCEAAGRANGAAVDWVTGAGIKGGEAGMVRRLAAVAAVVAACQAVYALAG
ncbi:10 TM acyl transferase domain found in Cas1p-domain-containing protein [Hyaloraphidium curvatum]|nr:10 TM acyl transferase domain found in Cas1p-domain-containing protein [Hyaloraphidium curvatum]